MSKDKKRFAERLMEVLLLFIIGVFVLFYVYASFTTGPSPTGNFVSPSE